jgi:hypothetical protein
MLASGPPIASRYRGSKRITTLEEYYGHDEQTNKNKDEQYKQKATENGGTTQVATNLQSNVNPRIPERDLEESSYGNGHRSHRHKWLTAKEPHACRGSRWSESEATHRFRAQAKQFDTGTRDFNRRSRPSANELIASIQRKN